MRSIMLSLLVLSLCSVGIAQSSLNGTWVPVQQEMGGKTLPESAFKTQKLIMNDSTYTFTAESVDKGIVKYADGKMDIYGREGINTGKHYTAIYKFENGQLSICYNLRGNNYPEAFETQSQPMLFLSVYKKE
jgi:uncharacterized protein (TIGR03067 family)